MTTNSLSCLIIIITVVDSELKTNRRGERRGILILNIFSIKSKFSIFWEI